MRADIGTSVTLDTVLRLPYGDIYGNAALLISRRTAGGGAVHVILECGYGQGIALLCVYFCLDFIYKAYYVSSAALCMGGC